MVEQFISDWSKDRSYASFTERKSVKLYEEFTEPQSGNRIVYLFSAVPYKSFIAPESQIKADVYDSFVNII